MPFLVMELLEGEDLDSSLQRGAPRAQLALEVLRQVFHAVAAAHDAGVVHRDLKPENVYLARSRRSEAGIDVKVLDFGIAKLSADYDAHKSGTQAMGTPLWMSPEQHRKGQITAAADIWSLGLITFSVFTAKNFWNAGQNGATADLIEVIRETCIDNIPPASARARELGVAHLLPAGFDSWFARSVVRDPESRFQSAREMFDDLVRRYQPTVAEPATASAPAGPTSTYDKDIATELARAGNTRRRIQIAVLLSAAALALAGSASLVLMSRDHVRARNLSWSRLSMCWFGGAPPKGGTTASRIRAAQIGAILSDVAQEEPWPLRCAPYAERLLSTLKETGGLSEREGDLGEQIRQLRDTVMPVDPTLMAQRLERLVESAGAHGLTYQSEGVSGVTPAPPVPPATFSFDSLLGQQSISWSILSLPHERGNVGRLKFFRSDGNVPRFIEVEGDHVVRRDIVADRADSPPRSSEANLRRDFVSGPTIASWPGSVTVHGSTTNFPLLEFTNDRTTSLVRATDGRTIIQRTLSTVLGVLATEAVSAAVLTTSPATVESPSPEKVTLLRLPTSSGRSASEDLILNGWVGTKSALQVVDDWIVWVTRDASVVGQRVSLGDGAVGSPSTLASSDVSGISNKTGSVEGAELASCKSVAGWAVQPRARYGATTSVLSYHGGKWVRRTSVFGRLECDTNAFYVFDAQFALRCPYEDGDCVKVTNIDVSTDDMIMDSQLIRLRKVEDLLVLRVEPVAVTHTPRYFVWDSRAESGGLRAAGRLDESPRLAAIAGTGIIAELSVEGKVHLVRVDPVSGAIRPVALPEPGSL